MSSLSQIFHNSAVAAHEAFRDRLENLVILVTPLETPVYVSPEIADHLTKNVNAVKEAVQERISALRRRNAWGITDHKYPLAGAPVKLITLMRNASAIISPGFTQEMMDTCAFNHEMGHLVVENGLGGDPYVGECAADAYAALRHVQIFGKNTDFFEYYNRAGTIVLGLSPIHYTDAAIQRVKQISEKKDLSKLSLQQTAALAAKIAARYSLKPEMLIKISGAFYPVEKACTRHIGEKSETIIKLLREDRDALILFCKETLAVMRERQNDPDIFKAGKQFLSHPSRKKFMLEMAKTYPWWQEALDFVTTHKPAPQKAKPPTRRL